MTNSKWTIIIIANLENNSFLYVDELFDSISNNIQENSEVNLILLADKLRVSVDSKITDSKYTIFEKDKYSLVSVYEIKRGIKYADDKAIFEETDFRRDNLYKEENLEFYLDLIKEKYPANNYGVIYKSHGGNNTDFIDRFVESLIFKVEGEEEIKLILESINKKTEFIPTKRIENLWNKKHDEKYWMPAEIEILENDKQSVNSENTPLICLLTYKGKRKGNDFKELSYKTFSHVLSNKFGKNGLEFLLFDCCWGMRFEIASLFYNVSKYLIGSIDESPLVGIGYDIWTKSLTKFPDMKGEELAKMLVSQFYISRFNDYIDFELKDPKKGDFYNYGLSMTCIDLSKFLQTAVNFTSVVNTLTFLIKEKSTANYTTKLIFEARQKCKDYTYDLEADAYPIFNIDLIWFFENLIFQIERQDLEYKINDYENVISSLKSEIQKAIIEIKLKLIIAYCQNNYLTPIPNDKDAYTGGYGISITFPNNPNLEQYWNLQEYENFPEYLSTGWTDLLKLYYTNAQELSLFKI